MIPVTSVEQRSMAPACRTLKLPRKRALCHRSRLLTCSLAHRLLLLHCSVSRRLATQLCLARNIGGAASALHAVPVRAGSSMAKSATAADPLRAHLQNELAVSQQASHGLEQLLVCCAGSSSACWLLFASFCAGHSIRWYVQE